MQLTNILLTALAATASARSTPSARRQASSTPGCRLVAPTDLNFDVADLRSGTVVTKVLTFPVGPTTAGPCQLIGAFSQGFPVDQGGDAFARLNVRALDGPSAGSLVGSFGPLEVENGVVVRDTEQVVNSFQCRESLAFEFSIANDADVDVDINVTFTASELGGFFIQVGDQCN
ncbi:hypothetical protein CORC01_05603 [Colletotrichum orchidophilum]|uniref:Ubiquitin 3 binding protein But2 C-terminal domain-containing protein n=1 Tax=Colletotrichum orchidophilum TaxID=1209926 RepID=A0A1G4BCM0_9PEZI|nr:uncharacterized protein CORC01_05603 [Colletotrichum orchidophilum]OHE99110.1 hypothetical protein CORC01_05603 [Colletotrichum orchidophilum]